MCDKAHCKQSIAELDFDVPTCDGTQCISSGLGNVGIIEGTLPSGCATRESFV